ncbi:hypothetical protein BH09ACT12_BH09ACT12_23350 [soil metagenome]
MLPGLNALHCWWAVRRLDQYLDADPSAPLTDAEMERLEQHATTCRNCAARLGTRRRTRDALRSYDSRRPTDADALERLGAVAGHLRSTGRGPA